MDWNELFLIGGKIVAVFFLVLLNGFFVAAEFALVKVRDTQLESYVVKGQRRAKVARKILHNLDAALSSTQLGITLASLALGWIGEDVFVHLLKPVTHFVGITSPETEETIAVIFGFATITFLHIVAGELAPKSLAIRKSLHTSLWVAVPLDLFYRVSFPLIWILNHTANWLLRRFGIEPVTESELVHSEEEVRLIVGASQKYSGGLPFGRAIVLNALDLRHRTVREVMRPRQEITVLDTEATMAECLEVSEKTRYSRFPLAEAGDIDRTLGVIHFKDLFAMRLKARSGADLLPIARKLIYVPETARLERVLQTFLERKSHLAIVVDEYGGTMGLVTLENILEEIVGQIQDEFDQENPLLTRVNENTWDIAGGLPLHELEEIVGERLREEGITTASGWVTQRLGGFPKTGDLLHVGQFSVRVEEMEGTRVGKLRLTRKLPDAEAGGAD